MNNLVKSTLCRAMLCALLLLTAGCASTDSLYAEYEFCQCPSAKAESADVAKPPDAAGDQDLSLR